MKRFIFLTGIALIYFNICTSQPNEKRVFIAGSEVILNGNEQCEKFIITQAINQETALNIWSSKELIFINDELDHIIDIEEGLKNERDLSENEKSFSYIPVEPHTIYTIEKAMNSDSYLGGNPPRKFQFPDIKLDAPFQYIGKLSKSADGLDWLPFDLHIVAPVYLNFDKIFLDYSNPEKPQVINVEELKKSDTSYDEIKPESQVIYSKTPIKFKESTDFGYNIGHSGVPNWIQYPSIPNCPVSGKIMRFVCQLKSDSGIETESTNVVSEDDEPLDYMESMNFWGDGDLFIFFEPESKVMCIFIQNT